MYPNPRPTGERPLTLNDFRAMHDAGEKIACLTAYDASFARLADAAGVEIVLVGDSLGMVIHGQGTTVGVVNADIVYHTRAVATGLSRAFLMADMPFLSFATRDQAIRSAQELMQQGGAKMVKLEGGAIQADIVEFLTSRGVPVCGHLGLQPQLIHKLGGFKVQGREEALAAQMREDARVLEQAGADMLLIECVPSGLARDITSAAGVPVIGIGAGPHVDAQILVMHDILGVSRGRVPRFVKNFLSGRDDVEEAMRAYVQEVKSGAYPAPEHGFGE
ncbi:MAG: 3-methyl-2-oxobutanoate hydroxymethyltransferase [Oceanococcaceae bacterium]